MTDPLRVSLSERLRKKANTCRACRGTGRVDRREWQEGTREWEYVGGANPCPDCELLREAAEAFVVKPDPPPVLVPEVDDADDFEQRVAHLLPDAVLPSVEQMKRECAALDIHVVQPEPQIAEQQLQALKDFLDTCLCTECG